MVMKDEDSNRESAFHADLIKQTSLTQTERLKKTNYNSIVMFYVPNLYLCMITKMYNYILFRMHEIVKKIKF